MEIVFGPPLHFKSLDYVVVAEQVEDAVRAL
jgi:hypothetical protein